MRMTAPAIALLVAVTGVMAVVRVDGQSRRSSAPSAPAIAEKQKALLDRSCVTCHNDRVKTANLSLKGSTSRGVGDTPSCGRRWSASCAPA